MSILLRYANEHMMALTLGGYICYTCTGKQVLTANSYVRSLINNPGGSNFELVIMDMRFYASSEAFVTVQKSPTTNLPTTSQSITLSNMNKTYAGVSTHLADTGLAMSGGTDMKYCSGVGGTEESNLITPFVIPPNTTLGFNMTAANNANCYMSYVWMERTI